MQYIFITETKHKQRSVTGKYTTLDRQNPIQKSILLKDTTGKMPHNLSTTTAESELKFVIRECHDSINCQTF